MSLLPCVTSVNEAASCAGFDATAYSSGLTNPTPARVAGCEVHVCEALVTASIAAQIGAEEDVPPIVVQPPSEASYTVTAPVNSSPWEETSGRRRHGVEGPAPATVDWQKLVG